MSDEADGTSRDEARAQEAAALGNKLVEVAQTLKDLALSPLAAAGYDAVSLYGFVSDNVRGLGHLRSLAGSAIARAARCGNSSESVDYINYALAVGKVIVAVEDNVTTQTRKGRAAFVAALGVKLPGPDAELRDLHDDWLARLGGHSPEIMDAVTPSIAP